MGTSTISMAIFNSYVCLPDGRHSNIPISVFCFNFEASPIFHLFMGRTTIPWCFCPGVRPLVRPWSAKELATIEEGSGTARHCTSAEGWWR